MGPVGEREAGVSAAGSEAFRDAIRLTVRSGDTRGAFAVVNGDRIVVGRADDCDLVVGDPKVSRRHAAVEPLPDGRASLVDLESGNGTFVNGRRVDSVVLEGREQIQLGDTVLVTSRGKPSGASRTVTGSAPAQTPSLVQRLMLQRSVRRATLVSGAAVCLAVLLAVLLLTGILGGGGEDQAETVQRVVREAEPATVVIEARGGPDGTGWVLDADAGLVVTNAHVVDGGSAIQVGVGGELRRASLVGIAPCEDLAVIRVRNPSGLEQVSLGRQSDLARGETVVAVGYPSDASLETNLAVTTGVVSVVRSAYRERTLDLPRFPNVLQTDAAINPGSSGGPLLDLEGRLIGVSSAGRTLTPDGRIIQGQSYAIGVDRVRQVTTTLRRGRSMGWTGAAFDHPTPAELKRRDLPPGLLVAGTAPGSAAARAGLGRGERHVVGVNGQPIDNSLASYCDAIQGLPSGKRVILSVLAPGARAPRSVRLALE